MTNKEYKLSKYTYTFLSNLDFHRSFLTLSVL